MKKKVTPRNLAVVLDKLFVYCSKDKESAKQFCKAFDEFLDELVNHDFFGTEAQCDPRGDQRD